MNDGSQITPRSDALTRPELRRRATAGLFVLTSQNVVNLVLAFGGNIVLARLLLPRDFGLVAIGLTLMIFGESICDGGLGSGLIRRPLAPSRDELRTVLAFQLAITLVLGAVAAAVAVNFGSGGLLIGVMMAGLPLAALQTPGRVVLDRQLRYERLAAADLAGVVAHYAWAITGVVAGYGVWALGTATLVRPLVTALLLMRLSGLGALLPSLRARREVRALIGFGVRFQGVSLTIVLRDQGLNAVTGAIAGLTTLGLWSFASRLMQLPLLFFQALWRVSFPAMAQLLAAGDNPAPLIRRSVALSATMSALTLSPFAAASLELVPAVFGGAWRDAGEVMPWAAVALLVGGPVSVSTVGYLYAANRPGSVLRAATAFAVVWISTSAALLPFLGVHALGIGWVAGSLADALILSLAASRLSGAAIWRPLAPPVSVGLAAGAVGIAVSGLVGSGAGAAAAGGGSAFALSAIGLLAIDRATLLETIGTALRSVQAATTRRGSPEPAQPVPT